MPHALNLSSPSLIKTVLYVLYLQRHLQIQIRAKSGNFFLLKVCRLYCQILLDFNLVLQPGRFIRRLRSEFVDDLIDE